MSARKSSLPKEIVTLRDQFRAPIAPLDEARIYAKLLKGDHASTQRALAELIGVSQARISQRLALLEMPQEVVKLMSLPDSELTERHARVIRQLPDAKLQVWLSRRVVSDHLTVNATTEIVRGMLAELGIKTNRRSAWSEAPGLHWRMQDGYLEVQVRGESQGHRIKALKRLVELLRKEPRE